MSDNVNNPSHYGGKDSIYEVIKIAEYYNADLYIFNLLKYCLRAGVKNEATELEDLKKGAWYLQRKIDRLEAQKQGVEINLSCEDKLSPDFVVTCQQLEDIISNSDQPKVIEELKVGDKIKAIDYLYMHDNTANLSLIKDKYYIIKDIVRGLNIIVASEYDKNHYFTLSDLNEFFHVTHSQGVLTKENIQDIKDSNYQDNLNEGYH